MSTASNSTLHHVHDAAAGVHAPPAASWRALLGWELRRIARSGIFWSAIALLAVAFCAGARVGGAFQRAQAAAQHAQTAADAAWQRAIEQRARDYAHPAAQPAPYWQDPTDLAGFSRYQLRRHAYKPVLPLAPLSIGASDLAPSRWPVKLETLFGVEPAYDFEPPRSLAVGRFDLGFAIVTLLPVVVIALAALLGTAERDRGMLRLIAAQPVAPLAWLSARLAALSFWLLPVVAAALTLALFVGGADPTAAWPEWIAALALVAAYALFWLALAFVVLAAWPGAAGAIGSLLALWLTLSLALPLLGRFVADGVQPAPSRVLYVDAQRRAEDAVAGARDALVAEAFRSRADLAALTDRVANLDYATRQSFLVPMIETRLAVWNDRIAAHRRSRETLSSVLGYVAPPLGMDTALATLAGTDMARQRDAERQVRIYQQQLRDFFWPRMQREIAHPAPRPPGSYARLNFTDYTAIPAFVPAVEPRRGRVNAVLPFAAWLVVAALALAGLAAWRLRRWPAPL